MASLMDRFLDQVSIRGVVARLGLKRLGVGALLIAMSLPPLIVRVHPVQFMQEFSLEMALRYLPLAVLFCLSVLAGAAFIWRYERKTWGSIRDLLIVSTLIIGMLWTTRAVMWLHPDTPLYLLPIPLGALLATWLLSSNLGLLVAVVTSLNATLMGVSTDVGAVGVLIWAITGAVAASMISERRATLSVGALLVLSGAIVAFAATLGLQQPLSAALDSARWGAVGGFLSAILGYGLLPFFENVFRVTTDVRLLELTSSSHPLLRRLMQEAPGTYSHSIITGNLAEAGAEATGARALLARAGAYYHDVGKLRRPGFFAENQGGEGNPHDSRLPSLSALIITAHVREGVELAREHSLPQEVIDIIRQHHGTSLVSYFYSKASEGNTPVYEADFRYDGDAPHSREAALVMLADCAEAAVRALRKPTAIRVENAVRRVIENKVADGQLTHSTLTLADIESVIQVYTKVLKAINHSRVEYYEPLTVRSEYADKSRESSRA